MTKTKEDLKLFIGAGSGEDPELDAVIEDCFNEAVALVTKYNVKKDAVTGDYVASDAPEVLVDRCVMQVGQDLYALRESRGGVLNAQYADGDGIAASPIRIARDPLASAYKILGRWVLPF